MKNLLDFVLTHLVTYPESIEIMESTNDYGDAVLNIKVHEEDIPRVIGKNGNMIKALRKIVQSLAASSNQRVHLQIED